MAKKFNVTGLCLAKEHYMADVSRKLEEVQQTIESYIIKRNNEK